MKWVNLLKVPRTEERLKGIISKFRRPHKLADKFSC